MCPDEIGTVGNYAMRIIFLVPVVSNHNTNNFGAINDITSCLFLPMHQKH